MKLIKTLVLLWTHLADNMFCKRQVCERKVLGNLRTLLDTSEGIGAVTQLFGPIIRLQETVCPFRLKNSPHSAQRIVLIVVIVIPFLGKDRDR